MTEKDVVSDMRLLDRLCDKFEDEYASSGASAIPKLLKSVDREHRRELLNMLVAIDMELLAVHGPLPAIREYQIRIGLDNSAVELAYRKALSRLPEDVIAETEFFHGVESAKSVDEDIKKAVKVRGLELGQEIGRGGMGAVYCARQTSLNRLTAVKMLPKDRIQDPEARSRFQREMHAIGKLEHPNIVRAYDAELDVEHPFLVMELVRGADLTDLVNQKKGLSVAHACELVRQAADGLQHAHEQGIIHRDIKPSNLMLDQLGVVRILDFGLTKLRKEESHNESQLTQTGIAFGSIHYMAPEQFEDSHAVDARADIYSLGCVFFYLLTGRRPFGEGTSNALALLRAHTSSAIPSAREQRPDVPEKLDNILHRMLAKSPNDRFASASEVKQQLEDWASALGLASVATEKVAGSRALSQAGIDTSRRLQSGTIPNTRHKKKRAVGIVRYLWLAMMGCLLTLASTIVYVKTDYGTLRIEVLDPRIRLQIEGTEITVNESGRLLQLRAGSKRIRIRSMELNIDVEKEFVLLRGDDQRLLHVTLLPDNVAELVEGPAPRNAPPTARIADSSVQERLKQPSVHVPGIPHLERIEDPRTEPVFDGSAATIDARRQWYRDKHLARRELFSLPAPTETVGGSDFPRQIELPLKSEPSTDLVAKYFRDREAKTELDRTRLDELKLSNYYRGYFDKQNRLVEITCFKTDGSTSDQPDGYATQRFWYHPNGQMLQNAFFTALGELCLNENGVAIKCINQHGAMEPYESRIYGIDGSLAEDIRGVHRSIHRTDGITLDYRLDGRPKLEWLEPLDLGNRFNENYGWMPAFAPSGKELYFCVGWAGAKPPVMSRVVRSFWNGHRWSDPKPVEVDGKELTGIRPSISKDGRTMLVNAWKQNRYAGGLYGDQYPNLPSLGGADLYSVSREDDLWSNVTNVGSPINTESNEEFGSAFDPRDGSLIFCRRESDGSYKIFRASHDGMRFKEPEKLDFDGFMNPECSHDGNILLLQSSLHRKLFYSEREGDSWSKPTMLDTLDSSLSQADPVLTPDGSCLYFSCAARGWKMYASGRADSETAINHMASLFAWEEWKQPGPPLDVPLSQARSVADPYSATVDVIADENHYRLPLNAQNTQLSKPLLFNSLGHFFEFFEIDVPSGGLESEATTLNESGSVVGSSLVSQRQEYRRFHLYGTTLAHLDSGKALAINSKGHAAGVGYFDTPRAAVWREGEIIDLGVLIEGRNRNSSALGINNKGDVVGWSDAADGNKHAFLWSNQLMIDITECQGHANAINDAGTITGWLRKDRDENSRAFIYSDGTLQLLERPRDDVSGEGLDINQAGVVCGWVHTAPSDLAHAVVWKNGKLIDLGTLGGSKSSAMGLNNQDQVVGWSRVLLADIQGTHAFYFDGEQLIDVNPPGWSHSLANDINDRGWIVGRGTNAAGQKRGFLLKPARRPASLPQLVSARAEIDRGLAPDPANASNIRLRTGLQEAMRAHAGTLHYIEAAELLARIPAFSDLLERSKIAPYELRAAGQGAISNAPKELVAIYGGSQLNHWSGSYCVAASDDGRRIASGGYDNSLKVWDATSYELLWTASEHSGLIHDVAFSRAGRLLATACNDGVIKIWNVATGKCVSTLTGHENSVRQVAFIDNDRRLISVGWDRRVRFWNLRTNSVENTILEHEKIVVAMDVSIDETLLATGGGDNTIIVWNLKQGVVTAKLTGHTAEVRCVAFVPGSPLLVSGSHDGTARLWDFTKQKEVRKFDLGTDPVNAIAVSPDAQIVATSGGNLGLNAALWDMKSGGRLRLLSGQYEEVRDMTFSRDGNRLYSAGLDGCIHIWDTATGKELSAGLSPKGMRAVSISSDGEKLAAISIDSQVYLGEVGRDPALKVLAGHRSIGQDICFNSTGTNLVSGSSDGFVRVWDIASSKQVWNKHLQIGRTRSVAFHPSQDVVAVGGQQVFVLRLLNSKTGKEIRTITDLDGDVQCVQFSPDGAYIAAGTYAGSVYLFRFEDWKKVGELNRLHTRVHQIRFAPSGSILATCGRANDIRIWSVPELQPVSRIVADSAGSMDGLAFSNDGRLLASSSFDGKVRFWATSNWSLINTIHLAPAGSLIRGLTFTPESRHIITANENGTLYVLRLARIDGRQ